MEQIDPTNCSFPQNYTVVGIFDESYGKGFDEEGFKVIFEMKYAALKTWEAVAVNQSNFEFAFWLSQNTNLMYQLSNYAIYKLPEPRLDYYKYKSFGEVLDHVLDNFAEL